MSFKELDINKSYKSKGDNNIVESFLNPVLKQAIVYKRSVGFFSSSSLELIADGLVDLYRNGGKIYLIVSPNLSEEDQQAIKLGYDRREELLKDHFSIEFEKQLEELEEQKLELLCDLITYNVLEIKIVVTDDGGMYHDKLGILTDKDDNKIVFFGSSNSSMGGYKTNYEKIRVTKSWDEKTEDVILDEEEEFDSIWNGENDYVDTYEYTEAAKASIMKTREKKKATSKSFTIKLRDYQNDAIDSWVNNNYRGFYVMATGTGKTWTAIFSAKKLLETKDVSIVICAPYKHLIKQWGADLEMVFPDAKIILVSSENPDYNKAIIDASVDRKVGNKKQIIIISTIASFESDKFKSAMSKLDGERLLIVDEAHRFTKRREELKEEYQYLLGLSATPITGKNIDSGNELLEFFGGKVFDLPIEDALKKGFLVPYRYMPVFVNATEEEEEKFNKQSKMMASCFRNNKLINKDLFTRCYRNRLRVISMADEKQKQLPRFCEMIDEKDHVVVYCGDGKLFDDDREEERKHIDFVKRILNESGYKSHQFTAEEKMDERMQLVDDFNKENLTALAAIRCLDEGINIPSIKSALILSSNDDYREFIQRRGRILRLYEDKKAATIYDIVVLPSQETKKWAEIELRRYYEYGRLAMNWKDIEEKFFGLVDEYSLELSDISIYNEMDLEDDRDE